MLLVSTSADFTRFERVSTCCTAIISYCNAAIYPHIPATAEISQQPNENVPDPARQPRFHGARSPAARVGAPACPRAAGKTAAQARSISRCRAAALMALSPGACSIICSTMAASRSRASPARPAGRGERDHAGRRAHPRRPGRGAQAARRLLARGERRRPPARPAARRGRAAVSLRAARRPVARRDVADALALRSQPAQHQSAQGPDRALRRLRRDPRDHASRALHLRHQRPHRRAARVHARGDHAGGGDGFGLRCRCCSARWRSTACPTGTAATAAIRRSSRSCARPRPRTC